MEFVLLYKIGVIIDTIVKGGYALAGVYAVRTGYRYYQDYKHSVEQDNVEVK